MEMHVHVDGAPWRGGADGGGVQFYSVVELVEKDGSVSSLLKVFNDQSSSDQIVQFLRLLTSAFIRNRADFFRHFIDEEMDIKDFCTHVGPRAQALGTQPPALGSALIPLSLGDFSTNIPNQGLECQVCTATQRALG